MVITITTLQSLRTFADRHGEIAFVGLCDAAERALKGDRREAWAVERVAEVLMWATPVESDDAEQLKLRSIRAMDCTRPDGESVTR